MNIYQRYFKVESGDLIADVLESIRINNQANDQYKLILDDIGALPKYYHIDMRVTSICFEITPDTNIYKRTEQGWYPKKNTKFGRDLHNKLRKIKVKPIDDSLRIIGLESFPTIIHGHTGYSSTIFYTPSDPIVCYVSVPWYDEDPKVLEEYLTDRNNGISFNCAYDHLLWEPTKDMIEVKEWEVKKAVDDWNSSLQTQNNIN